MNRYHVKLRLFLGHYEKSASHFVTAENELEAGTLAIRGECHNDPVWEDDTKQECWDDDMVYRVMSSRIVPEGLEALACLRKDFEMLEDESWVPDHHSIEASLMMVDVAEAAIREAEETV